MITATKPIVDANGDTFNQYILRLRMTGDNISCRLVPVRTDENGKAIEAVGHTRSIVVGDASQKGTQDVKTLMAAIENAVQAYVTATGI